MSLEPRSDEGVPELTARMVRAAFPKGTLAIRVREALGPVFADGDFAAAFPGQGRPAAPPGALALIRHETEEKVPEAVPARLSDAGLLRAGGRQRTDPAHVPASVRTLNRMEFVGETLRAALEALAAAAPGWLAPLTGASRADRYGARTGSCRFPEGEDARARWAGQAGRDGFALPGAVTAPGTPGWLGEVPAVGALRRAREEQYRRNGREVRWREGRDLPPGADRMAPPCDPDARYGVKRGHRWTGYKAHLTETCDDGAPRLITNVETTGATAGDAEMTQVIHQRLAGRGLAPAEPAADAGYVSARGVLTARDDHGITCPARSAPTPPGAARSRSCPSPLSVPTGTPGRPPALRERPASSGLTSANPAASPSPGSTSRSPAAARARCGPGAPRPPTAGTAAA